MRFIRVFFVVENLGSGFIEKSDPSLTRLCLVERVSIIIARELNKMQQAQMYFVYFAPLVILELSVLAQSLDR